MRVMTPVGPDVVRWIACPNHVIALDCAVNVTINAQVVIIIATATWLLDKAQSKQAPLTPR
jgi:hypothetical protein